MRVIKIWNVILVILFVLLFVSIYNTLSNRKSYNNYLINKEINFKDKSMESKTFIDSLNYTPSSIIPFWFWNGNMTKKEIKRQINLIKDVGINELMIHARSGLEQEYLSEEWFELVGFALDELKKNNMKVWIYDEFDWPSGTAGGKVLENNSHFIAKNLKMEKVNKSYFSLKTNEKFNVEKIVSVIIYEKDSKKNVKNNYCIENSCFFEDLYLNNSIYVFYQDFGHFRTEYKKNYYVDLLDSETTKTFIRLTHEEYYERFSDYFQDTIVGFFTDEPGFYSNVYEEYDIGSIPWTDDFETDFYEIEEYNITDYLYFIWEEGDSNISRKVRKDYFEVRNTIYSKNYFEIIRNWTREHNVLFSGHLLIEEDLSQIVLFQGDFFTSIKYFDIPGTDDINEFNKNKITPLLASSAEFIYGKPYSLTETFAGYGWDLSYNEVLKTSEWLYENGIDIIVVHALFYTTEGEIQYNDYPPSFFYQNEMIWGHIPDYLNYTTGILYSEDQQKETVFIRYPISEAWEVFNPFDFSCIEKIDKEMKQTIAYYKKKGKYIILVPDYILEK